SKTSECDHFGITDGRHRRDARADRLAIEMHGAGAALREPATEMRIAQSELVTQRIEQRHVRIGIDRMHLAVDVQREFLVHGYPPETSGRPDFFQGFTGVGRVVQPAGVGNLGAWLNLCERTALLASNRSPGGKSAFTRVHSALKTRVTAL